MKWLACFALSSISMLKLSEVLKPNATDVAAMSFSTVLRYAYRLQALLVELVENAQTSAHHDGNNRINFFFFQVCEQECLTYPLLPPFPTR